MDQTGNGLGRFTIARRDIYIILVDKEMRLDDSLRGNLGAASDKSPVVGLSGEITL